MALGVERGSPLSKFMVGLPQQVWEPRLGFSASHPMYPYKAVRCFLCPPRTGTRVPPPEDSLLLGQQVYYQMISRVWSSAWE